VAAAKAAGMYCVGFRNPASGAQDLSRADIVLDSFNDIASNSRLFLNDFSSGVNGNLS